jgi:flagellar biosynthesis/type III secretory pathway M-ring protein FliF/YscJ
MKFFGKIFMHADIEDGTINKISKKLDELKVKFSVEGTILYIPETEIEKLPMMESQPALPYTDDDGYSIYEVFPFSFDKAFAM